MLRVAQYVQTETVPATNDDISPHAAIVSTAASIKAMQAGAQHKPQASMDSMRAQVMPGAALHQVGHLKQPQYAANTYRKMVQHWMTLVAVDRLDGCSCTHTGISSRKCFVDPVQKVSLTVQAMERSTAVMSIGALPILVALAGGVPESKSAKTSNDAAALQLEAISCLR